MPRMTQAELNAYQARQSRLNRISIGPDAAAPSRAQVAEKKLHAQIEAECKRRGWLALTSRMDRRSTIMEGFPDYVIFTDMKLLSWDARPQVLIGEVKVGQEKLTQAQLGVHAWLRKLGFLVHVWRSLEEFMESAK